MQFSIPDNTLLYRKIKIRQERKKTERKKEKRDRKNERMNTDKGTRTK